MRILFQRVLAPYMELLPSELCPCERISCFDGVVLCVVPCLQGPSGQEIRRFWQRGPNWQRAIPNSLVSWQPVHCTPVAQPNSQQL